MKWPYSLKNKLSVSIILTIIILLILLVNIQNRQRFEQLDHSMSSIYEDRLMVQNYLFKLYDNLQKEEKLRNSTSNSIIKDLAELKEERQQIISKYEETYLTEKERKEFTNFLNHLNKKDKLEQQILESKDSTTRVNLHEAFETNTAKTLNSMRNLSNIQTQEGKALQISSHKIVLGSLSISQLELAILIVLALVIQVLIFTSKTLKIKTHTPHHLN